MNKLLNANFSRLWKNKCFFFCLGIMFFGSLFYMINCCQIVREDMIENEMHLEDYYFRFSIIVGLFIAVFSTLFLSREYSDGTVRNKIIAGYSRRSIYLSHFILTFFASFLMLIAGMAGGLAGIPTLGGFSEVQFFSYLLVTVMFVMAFCAIDTCINLLFQNRAFSAIFTVLAFFVLLYLASLLEKILLAPDTVFSDISFVNGEVTFADPMPNPRYVDGIKRQILDFFVDFLPTGQGMRMAYLRVVHPVRMIFSSVFLTVFVTVFGMFLFEKKDLK